MLRLVIAIAVLFPTIAAATWKPIYGKEPAAVQRWFRAAMVTPEAAHRLPVRMCCEKAERLRTKFVGAGNDWSYYPDPNCTDDGCKLLPIPNDIVHEDGIHALDPKNDNLPQFKAMRREGVLFIWSGVPTCFWPPEASG